MVSFVVNLIWSIFFGLEMAIGYCILGCLWCITILGIHGCVMYAKRTVFDLVLPRIMADDEIFPEEVAAYGEGGLCLNCKVCTFPNCGFGK